MGLADFDHGIPMTSGAKKSIKLSITHKGLVLVIVPLLFEMIFLAVLYAKFSDTLSWLEQMDHSKDAILEQHRIQLASVRSFVMIFDTRGQVKQKELDELHKHLQTKDWNRVSYRLYPELREIIDRGQESRQSLLNMVDRKRQAMMSGTDYPFSRQGIYEAFEDMNRLSEKTMEVETRVREAVPGEVNDLRFQLLAGIVGGMTFSTLLTLWLAYYFSNDVVKRLHRIQDNTLRLTAQIPLPMPEAGGDEIAGLDRAIFETSKELEELRERESAILDNAADVICSLDSKLRFHSSNAALTRLWSYEIGDLLGKSLVTILEPRTVDDTKTNFQLIAEGAGDGELENIVRVKDGSFRNILWTIHWSRDESMYFCIAHDVTEIRAMQKLKQEFLSIAGHDLRTPLTSVSLTVARLLDGKATSAPERVRRELLKTQGTITRLVELVNELLELEKLESGKIVLTLDGISASDICTMACETLEGMATRARITLEKPKGDFAIIGDERRLVQVVTNLISNAIKFSPIGSIITIELRRVLENEDAVHERDDRPANKRSLEKSNTKSFIEIRISDRGPGIPSEDLGLIFEKFRQSRTSSTTTNIKGTGLGLAIVKAIVEAHGGTVGVESEEGKGSTFWFRIPEFQGDEEPIS